MKILWLDPGGTTGAAWLDLDMLVKDSIPHITTKDLGAEIDVYNLITMADWDIIGYESFHWQNRSKIDFRPVEVIGVIKLAQKQRKFKMTSQKPAVGLGFWTDKKLKAVGAYTVGSPHRRDATRHLLHFITFTRKDTRFVRKLA